MEKQPHMEIFKNPRCLLYYRYNDDIRFLTKPTPYSLMNDPNCQRNVFSLRVPDWMRLAHGGHNFCLVAVKEGLVY